MKLSYIIVLASVVIVCALFTVLHLFVVYQYPDEDPTCDGDDCDQSTEWTDQSQNRESQTEESSPCDNFYRFVCEHLSKTQHKLQMSTEVFVNQSSTIMKFLSESDNLNSSRAVSSAREFYSTCQKIDPTEDNLNKILDLFRKGGGFPVLGGDEFDDSKWTWLDTTRKLRELGMFTDSLFTTKLGSNPLDLRNTTFYLKNPRLDLAQREDCGKTYGCMVSFALEFCEVVTQLGVVREVAIIDGIELYNLEKKLLNMVWDNPANSKESQTVDQLRTLANLSSSFGFINWTEYFTILLGGEESVREDLVVVVENPGYLKSLEQVLEDTPNRLLANFMMWSVLYRLKEYIPGHQRTPSDCYKFLQNTMSYALQSMYVNTIQFDDTTSEKVVIEIAGGIKEELLKRVNSSDWMSAQTKRGVLEKVEEMKIKIGYPEILLNASFIDEYYENLSLYNNALESMLAVHKFHADKYYNLCCKRVEEIFWDLSVEVFLPLVYYDSAQNSIHILQGALQDPIFSVERSMSENFGRLGSVVAHEMIHAVDSIGYRYDADGKRKSSSDDPFLLAFEETSQCFVDQYNSFMELTEDVLLQNPQLSGEFKKLEIVADSVGVDLSFAAYKTYEKYLNQSDIQLVDKWFNPEQMFYVSFAQYYCVEYSEGELFPVLLDDHAPNPIRVSGTLKNSKDFGRVFGCEPGSVMNPSTKCGML